MLRIFAAVVGGVVFSLSLAGQSSISGYQMDVYAGSDIVRDGSPSSESLLSWPNDIAVDSIGNLYIADRDARLVRRVGIDGRVSTVAGSITGPFATQPATSRFLLPRRVAIGPGDTLYISDTQRVYRLLEDGSLEAVAGGGRETSVGGAAPDARFRSISDIAFSPAGTLFISDRLAHVIRKVGEGGIIQAVTGAGEPGFSGDGGPATAAQVNGPSHMDFDSAGNLIFGDVGNRRLRRIDTGGMISTIAGTGAVQSSGDDGPATAAGISLISAVNVAPDDSIYVAGFSSIRKIDPEGTIRRYSGRFGTDDFGDGGPVSDAVLRTVSAIEDGVASELYIADGEVASVRKIAPDGIITTFVGAKHLSVTGGPATEAQIFSPAGIAIDSLGNLLIADSRNGAVRRVSSNGTIETIAGGNPLSTQGDGGTLFSN